MKHKLKKRVTVAILSAMLAGMMSTTSFADVRFDLSDGQLDTVDGETYYITGKTGENSLNNININGGTVRILLDNVTMNLSDWVEAISIHSGANVTLALRGDNTITTGWGIIVTYGSTLNIVGDGSLTVLARNSSAIGNVMYDSRGMGNINIQSGTLDLKSEYGCGIGSVISKDGIGKVGDINISGGNVKAVGSTECAGIGSGDSNTMGNIYIGGDSVVEASSIQGAGIGTGTAGGNIAEHLGVISIGGNAEVNAVSYSGAGIGTGDKQDKKINIKIKDGARVYAESFKANSIGDGAESRDTQSSVEIEETTNVACISYRSDTLPDSAKATMAEIKMQSAPISNTKLYLVDSNGNEDIIEVPKDCYSVSKTVDNGAEYTIIADDGKSISEAAKVSVNDYTKEEIQLKNNGRYIYVSEFGRDRNTGLSAADPLQSFEKAYEIVDNNGTIVICGGTVDINRVPNLGKNIKITSKDSKYTYSKLKPSVNIDLSTRKVYDSILLEDIDVNGYGKYISAEVFTKVKFKGANINKIDGHTVPRVNNRTIYEQHGEITGNELIRDKEYSSKCYRYNGVYSINDITK